MKKWDKLADEKTIENTIAALKANGIDAQVVENGQEAKSKALELIALGSEVMTMTSVTLDTIGLSEEINKQGFSSNKQSFSSNKQGFSSNKQSFSSNRADGKFKPVRDKLYAMDRNTQQQEMNRLGAAPEFVVGSVHAVTEDGHVLIASNTGSQLPAYAFGALHVIWIVGAQKIVKDTDEGIKRINEHSLPLESERAKKAYGVPGSAVNKILIVSKEVQPGRIKLILVKEKLGF